ncbi:DUF1752-domain-containing protein [Basidiobolus meristosporus CBS 931.73]|uniref:DUF1752-domain-containing protein n=1 Tax=Basidiobolus meristosporus CBS 931.73 TaxID=1314790 RepID=A0A1Y1Y7U7_9FUNG|nr:DUF1752-domain-containing protein [Basidiobolus meristosporus CBS 931.73]|eukprot:ORX93654.1 DUF1752-domain-containing protein [Basidiobolus meristosporus CBS 931.73]
MPTILSEPVLTLALDNLHKLRDIDCDNLCSMWAVFTKCKENLLNGQRLENLSWRLWFRQASSERKLAPRASAEVGELPHEINPESCGKFVPMSGSDLAKTFSSLPRQLSSTSIHKLINTISPNPEIAENASMPLTDLSIMDEALPASDVDTLCNTFEEVPSQEVGIAIQDMNRDRTPDVLSKRKIFFLAESLEDEKCRGHVFEKSKNSQTVMDLQALARFPRDNSLEFSESNGSESTLDDEDWESIASSYQSTPANSNDCAFEKISVSKHSSQCEQPKTSLLSTLFQKRTPTSIPYSKPSVFKGLCTLNTPPEKEDDDDSLAKELSSSLHQNVLWQRQQHEHFCRPFHKEPSMTSLATKCEYHFATSPGYYGSGW